MFAKTSFRGYLFTLILLIPLGVSAEPDERYIVGYAPGNAPVLRAAVESLGGRVHRELTNHRLLAVSLPAAAATAIARRPGVVLVELDPKRYTQAEQTPYGITMVEAGPGGLAERFGHTRKLCIMDTGYDLGHEDLPVSGVTGDDGVPTGCAGSGCNADSGNWYHDGHGHGTHVAGTIAALSGNDVGVVGVNPSGSLPLHVVKVFDDQGKWAYGSDLIAALDQCRVAGAQVVSMSLGGAAASTAERVAFDEAYAAGVLSIAAAGNSGNATLSYPASYDSVMSVAAIDVNKRLATFSQFNHQVEIAAPGVGVNSTLPGNNYAAWDGTSMATPHVSGVAALVWSHHEGCTAAELRTALRAAAEDLGGPGWDSSYGYGLVRAQATDALLSGDCAVTAPPPVIATPLGNDVPVTVSGARADEIHFALDVPPGASDLVVQISGGTGDADLYVRYGSPAAADQWDCRPYINGNSETCTDAAPAFGTWHVMLRGYLDFANVTLRARYVDSGASSYPVYYFVDAETPTAGTVLGSFADLAYNDGVLQRLVEVTSGGKPANRTSFAEHAWHIANVSGGASVTLEVTAAGTDSGESDRFAFDVSYDGGQSWTKGVLTLPLGGALDTYWVPLQPTTSGDVLVRARDTDRTPRNLADDTLYVDQLRVVTVVDGNETAPAAPTDLVATAVMAGSVSLEWTDNADNEGGFEVRRASLGEAGWGTFDVVAQLNANTTSFVDTSVQPASSYRYRVAAVTAGYAEESNTVEVTTVAGIVLRASGEKRKGFVRVQLDWDGPTWVRIQRAIDGGPMMEIAVAETATGTPRRYTDETGLKGAPVLDYVVCAAPSGDDCSNTVRVTF